MRFIEITDGLLTQVNNEESLLVERIRQESTMPKASLTEREQEVARTLTTRGVLTRFKIDDELHFKLSS